MEQWQMKEKKKTYPELSEMNVCMYVCMYVMYVNVTLYDPCSS